MNRRNLLKSLVATVVLATTPLKTHLFDIYKDQNVYKNFSSEISDILARAAMSFLHNSDSEIYNNIFRLEYVATMNIVLQELKSNRKIYDYLIICDERNNKDDVNFRAEIWYKKYYSPSWFKWNHKINRVSPVS